MSTPRNFSVSPVRRAWRAACCPNESSCRISDRAADTEIARGHLSIAQQRETRLEREADENNAEEEEKEDEFSLAEQYVEDDPDNLTTREEFERNLRKDSDLSEGDITSIIDAKFGSGSENAVVNPCSGGRFGSRRRSYRTGPSVRQDLAQEEPGAIRLRVVEEF
jgi:hypothetical protein